MNFCSLYENVCYEQKASLLQDEEELQEKLRKMNFLQLVELQGYLESVIEALPEGYVARSGLRDVLQSVVSEIEKKEE